MNDLESIIDYGQGDDEWILQIFKAFKKFYEGFYELIDNGDAWWDAFNQSTYFNETMQREWQKIEDIDMISTLGNMANAMMGTYLKYEKFVDALESAYRGGHTHGAAHKD